MSLLNKLIALTTVLRCALTLHRRFPNEVNNASECGPFDVIGVLKTSYAVPECHAHY
jgi:hypothetical protein